MRKVWIVLTLTVGLVLSGCSAVFQEVVKVAGNDLQRTSELAAKYNKPEVKQCADFLLASIQKEDEGLARLNALLAEDTSGLASSALKAALVAEVIRGLDDPAARAQFEKDFQDNCQAVAGAIMMNILRDARKVGSRGLSR